MLKKKRYSSEEKTKILREHLEKQVPISDLADKYGVHPNAIYLWRKQVIENAPANLSKVESKKVERKQKIHNNPANQLQILQ